jgi:adenylylsulfate kinase
MIYYSNSKIHEPHMAFVGRWSPLHKGHISIIKKKLKDNPDLPILILVRDTDFDDYSAFFRAEVVKLWMREENIKGTIMIIPNVEGIYWGRGVGYNVGCVKVPQKVKAISGTKIRHGISNGFQNWEKLIAAEGTASLLTPKTAKIAQFGLVVWLTGCPCSGKTTLSQGLKKKIQGAYPHLKIQVLDGDVIRNTPLAQAVGFSPKDRALHIRRMAHFSKMFADHGVLVIAAFVSPDQKIREDAKKIVGKNRFMEVYVKASQQVRIDRDTKGMYAKAIKGEITNLTGYNAPYEEPKSPDLVCDTDQESVSESVAKLFQRIFG